jgi:hypothetical protein
MKESVDSATGKDSSSFFPHRPLLNVTYMDWAEGRVIYRRLPNPDINATSTVILLLTPTRLPFDGFQLIEGDQFPQSATMSPGHLQSYWLQQEGGSDAVDNGQSPSVASPTRP